MMKRVKVVLLMSLLAFQVNAQQKRALIHSDYDQWEDISSIKLSKNGSWVGYEINPQDGDGRLEIVAHDDPEGRLLVPRADNFTFSHDGNWVVGKIKAQKDSIRTLKLRKEKPENMPKDSLFVLSTVDGEMEKVAMVKSYQIPEKAGNWLALHFEKEESKKGDKVENDSTAKAGGAKKKLHTKGTLLSVRSFDGRVAYEIERVENYGFSEKGDWLYYILATEDTLANAGIGLLELNSGKNTIIDSCKTKYTGVTFSKDLKHVAYLFTTDSTEASKPYYKLSLYNIKKGKGLVVADQDTEGILKQGKLSESGSLRFSEDGKRLFFNVTEDYKDYPYAEDTTILDEERVSLDIWGWKDEEIQPMQLKNKGSDENKNYLAVYLLKKGEVVQLENRELDNIKLDQKAKHKIAVATDESPYRINYSWDIQIGRDVYLVNIETGEKELVAENVSGYPSLSPAAKFVSWYSYRDSSWVAYDISDGKTINLTAHVDGDFYDQLHDTPSLPGSYGSAGWTRNDEGFIVYDQFDVWKIDPKGKQAPLCITKKVGRRNQIRFRREVLDKEEEFIATEQPLVLSAFNEKSKKSGYFLGDFDGNREPKELLYSDHNYFGLEKAKESNRITVRRSTFKEYPDIYSADLTMNKLTRLSFANPQQKDINWGTVELTEYMTLQGDSLQGLIYKPENFDPNRKYPMMVYFYERKSDTFHHYISPVPSASIINIPYFVSNGYVVFVPDIKYEIGHPGPSAYNCIIPGVQSVVAKDYVDAGNIAIQGQSWGGYQVAYLITQTDMFKAAGAGAPVVNMTSAYGGIRWGTGMSRMFQYEQTQSRIGGTLWDKPMRYIENSPLFFVDKVSTPVLIMHNDQDGAVPWYQGIEFFMALKRNRTPAWLLVYNGEDHNLRQRKNRKDLSVRLSQFFDHYLKGAPAPLWMTEGIPAVEKGKVLKYELSE